ncbi:hypothetical protein [uncultured Planococcus sp.]|uniref:hypothetical protein n=1 Tax=uncultured Planococcus sp. TaxID=337815 RepID=UPI0026177EA0|nr:hypothetical protein [uncultured Planococcus sp.]
MKKIMVLLAVVLILAGCGEKEYFKQIYLEDVKGYMEEDKDGFMLIVTDNGESFQSYVEDVAESEEVDIDMYNVYQSKEGAEDERPVLPYDEIKRFSELYYIEDNKVQGALRVKDYEDMKLTEEVKHFVNLYE